MIALRKNELFFIAALAAGTLLGCGEEPIPERPTYAHDIMPLMGAHCIRCHGAGGTLNEDPDITGMTKGAPEAGNFTTIDGLLPYTGASTIAMKTYVVTIGMPPPPSDRLDDRSTEMLLRWCMNPLP